MVPVAAAGPSRYLATGSPSASSSSRMTVSSGRSSSRGVVDRSVSGGAVVEVGAFGSTAVVAVVAVRSEEHTSELQSLMRISYAVFCLKKKKKQQSYHTQR